MFFQRSKTCFSSRWLLKPCQRDLTNLRMQNGDVSVTVRGSSLPNLVGYYRGAGFTYRYETPDFLSAQDHPTIIVAVTVSAAPSRRIVIDRE